MTQRSINPATGEVFAEYPSRSDDQLQQCVDSAGKAFLTWRETLFAERAELLLKVAIGLEANADQYAHLMASEVGKILVEGRSEVEKSAWVCRYYAENGEEFLAPEHVETEAAESFVAFRPLGAILAVMPWNFPFWQVFRAAVPALMAGNTMLLKHASNVPGCALEIERIFCDAGFPVGVFQTILTSSDKVAGLIADPVIRGITLTGSTPAGRAVASAAGQQLKKCVLELGGSDPYVVLADAEVAAAAEVCVTSRLINCGQSCIAAKRFVVVESVREEFESAVVERMTRTRWGDPMDESSDIGPMARIDLRDGLHDQVVRSMEAGARCLVGGTYPGGAGAFYPPTVLTDVRPGIPAYEEELFGPVAAILPVADDESAIEVANDTSFGLGAAVFTSDIARGTRIATNQLEAGCCFVNGLVRSDPRMPFGGIKDSGSGRELSRFGIREFVNVKSIVVAG